MEKSPFSFPLFMVREDRFCPDTTACRYLLDNSPTFRIGHTDSSEDIEQKLRLRAWHISGKSPIDLKRGIENILTGSIHRGHSSSTFEISHQ
jgi:hypothetical protein